jgi:hypothetical protein
LIGIQEGIPDCWLLIENAGLIGNYNGFAKLIDVHKRIPNCWLPYRNAEIN